MQSEFIDKKTGQEDSTADNDLAVKQSLLLEVAMTFAHDVSQPLSATINYVQGAVRRLEAGGLEKMEIVTALKQAVVQAEYAASLLQQLRDFISQPKSAQSYLSVTEFINDAVRMLLPALLQNTIQLQLEFHIEEEQVLGDKVQLKQVLSNLVSNAIDALSLVTKQEKYIKITAQLYQDNEVQILIKDNGIGMQQEQLTKIFNPFYTTKKNGVGMGLAICRSIVERHRGKLFADSHSGVGTEFNLLLPLIRKRG